MILCNVCIIIYYLIAMRTILTYPCIYMLLYGMATNVIQSYDATASTKLQNYFLGKV